MISADIQADTLEEYYKKLYELQAKGHGEDYLHVHLEIRHHVKEGMSYTELGVNQGATLAAAMLKNPSKVRGYDITLSWYNKAKHLFEAYAAEHNIDFKVFEADTHKITIEPTDVLYIDTVHKYDHLKKELALHGNKALKKIIFHDMYHIKTGKETGLQKAVLEFVASNKGWQVVTTCRTSVGYMTIHRV